MHYFKKSIKRKSLLYILLTLLITGLASYKLGFNQTICLSAVLGECLLFAYISNLFIEASSEENLELSYQAIGFQMVHILFILLVNNFIQQGTYLEQIHFLNWLMEGKERASILRFEMVTMLLMGYGVLVLICYGRTLYKIMSKRLDFWFPSSWSLVIGVGAVVLTQTETSFFIKTLCVWIAGLVLLGSFLCKRREYRRYHIELKVKPGYYILSTLMILGITCAIGYLLPSIQELPGTRALRGLKSVFQTSTDVIEQIPYKSHINHEVPQSAGVVFEVESSVPLHLRSVSYRYYEDNSWYIPELSGEAGNTLYEVSKNELLTQYNQTQELLQEILLLRRLNSNLFREYQVFLNFEGSPRLKKNYRVLQNPINVRNYFTVNGFTDITDPNSKALYCYEELQSLYYYSERLVEPTYYQVTYLDNVPKMGSMEYAFLQNMNRKDFLVLWNKLEAYRQAFSGKGGYIKENAEDNSPLKLLLEAQQTYLQLPEKLKAPLQTLAKTVVDEAESDWKQAESLCNYLKENYTYDLQVKPVENGKDSVLTFLFQDKEGICQDFATSMVLLCRSVGLPARYISGYLATERKGASGYYMVREKDAHAFVEVYLAGYGWMSFDPTPLREESSEVMIQLAQGEKSGGLQKLIFGLFCGGMVLFFTRRLLAKGLWYIKFYMWPMSWGIEPLMETTVSFLESKAIGLLPGETLQEYGKRLYEAQIDILYLIGLFEAYKYGGILPTKAQMKKAGEATKQLRNQLRKRTN